VILAWVGLAAFVGAGYLTIRWLPDRYDSLGRVKPFPSIAVGGLVVIGAACLVPFFLRVRLETRLETASSAIVGVPVEVHCQAFGEAFVDAGMELGYVRFGPDGVPERRTLIKRQQCSHLADYVGGGHADVVHEQVVAVHTLTHEAIHMSGITSEAETECVAMQRDAEMARLLGAEPSEAMQLARYYWTNVYPRMPSPYSSPECRDGGSLDSNLPDAPWEATG
jgi:hypothetical protein